MNKELICSTDLGYKDFALLVKSATDEEVWRRKLRQLGIEIDFSPWGEVLERFLRKFRDTEDISGWFWNCIYDGETAEEMWEVLVDDERWF